MINLLIFCFLTMLVQIPQAQAGEKELYLRRTSLLLRGVPPKAAEIDSVQNLTSSEYKKFLAAKISEYSNSALFYEKMRVRILELLQLRISPRLSPELYSNTSFILERSNQFLSSQTGESVLDRYLIDLLKNNKNWDELITGYKYTFDLSNPNDRAELDFYQNVVNILPYSKSDAAITLNPSGDSERKALAGVITTPRFFERYFSNSSDLNRTRAMSIYRLFLCENNDPQCVACRQKPDLLGKAFEFSDIRPGIEKVNGRLSYKKQNGVVVDIPFKSIGEMAAAITKQSEFASCQVDHFWKWFFGENVHNFKKKNLIDYFNKNNRRPKDLIKKILLDNYDTYREEYAKHLSEAPSFADNFRRSLQNFDFYESLKYQFNLKADFISLCRLERLDLASLGLLDPRTGMRSPEKPNMVYYQLLAKCSAQLTQLDYPVIDVKYSQNIWKLSNQTERKQITSETIKKILGRNLYSNEVINRLADKIFAIVDPLINRADQEKNISFVINSIASYLVLTPEYLYL